MQVQALIAQAQQSLARTLGLEQTEARLEAQLLLQNILNVNRAWLIAHEHDALESNIHAEFDALLKRRLAGEPVAYILGRREFYGLDLSVTPATLIPRPDSETLVEAALAKTLASEPCRILDLGTGTGAIALAIASQRPHANVVAVDASRAALDIARRNAEKLAITNICLVQSDWFAALADEIFDIIVSNPPYIAQDDPHLSQGDLRFEPMAALASGADGLDDIRRIVHQTPCHLATHGWLMLEHGFDQAASVRALLQHAGLGSIASVADLSGIQRVTLGQLV